MSLWRGRVLSELFKDSVSDIKSDTRKYTDGTIIRARREGLAFQAVSSGGTTENAGGQKLLDLTFGELAVHQTQRVVERLNNNDDDCNIVVLGDSTGNETGEWVYLLATDLATQYPEFTVDYRLWDEGTSAYSAPSTIQVGTGANTLTFFNSSIAGSNANRFAADDFSQAIAGIDVDLLFVSYGHNGSDTPSKQINMMEALTGRSQRELPDVPVVIIGQNPVDGDETMAPKVDAFRALASRQGFGFINIHAAFKQYAENNPLGDLYADTVHPNSTGSELWKNVVLSAFSRTGGSGACGPQQGGQSGFIISATNDLIGFSRWDVSGNAAISGNATHFETASESIELTNTAGANGNIQTSLVTGDEIKQYIGKWVTLAVRVRVTVSQGSTAGRIAINDGVSTVTTDNGGPQGDGFYWQIVSMRLDASATRIRAFIYASTEASAETLHVDRAILVDGVIARDIASEYRRTFRNGFDLVGTDLGGLVSVRNTATGSTGIAFLSTNSGADDDDPATQYTAQLGGDQWGFKARGDSEDRLRITPSQGQLEFGVGTATPDTTIRSFGAGRLRIGGGSVEPDGDGSRDLGINGASWRRGYITEIRPLGNSVRWLSGTGTPEGVVTAGVGSLYTRSDGASGTTLYIKESGTGNTGWVAK